METVQKRIVAPGLRRPIVIIPFSCVHYGVKYHCADLFERFLRRAQEPHVYTIGLGDYLDFARSHKRMAFRVALPGDDDTGEQLDAMVASRLDEFIEKIRPISRRLIGLVEGNHRYEFFTTNKERGWISGETSTQYMARKLRVPYLSYLGSILLQIEVRGFKGPHDSMRILAHHGYGSSASSIGADLNRMERFLEPSYDADVIITAHTHRRVAYFKPRMILRSDGFQEQPVALIKAGSFFRSYVPGSSSYAEQHFKSPLDLGWVELRIWYELRDNKLIRYMEGAIQSHFEVTSCLTDTS